jgi:hypothetical protein
VFAVSGRALGVLPRRSSGQQLTRRPAHPGASLHGSPVWGQMAVPAPPSHQRGAGKLSTGVGGFKAQHVECGRILGPHCSQRHIKALISFFSFFTSDVSLPWPSALGLPGLWGLCASSVHAHVGGSKHWIQPPPPRHACGLPSSPTLMNQANARQDDEPSPVRTFSIAV